VKYLGGEPFITPELDDLIEFFTEKALIEKIDFRCNTNCTFYPKKLIDKLLRFKSLRIDLSVDGMDELCNFIRTGEAWGKVSEVIEQWLSLRDSNQRITLVLHHTSQALNLHQFDKIKKFAEDKKIHFSYSVLSHPRYLDFTVLPKSYVEDLIATETLIDKKLIDILKNTSYNNDNNRKFVSYVRDTDRILKTDLKTVIPALHKYLEFS
jgi:MoaA/NifB/PqqE/SkfB family radical SAM enzyme